MAAVTAVVTWTISGVVPGGTLPVAYVPGTDLMAAVGPLLPQLIVSTVVIGSVTVVAGWVYLAIAIAGLRGNRVLPGWILRRGVRTFAADLLMTVAFAAVFGVLALISIAGGPGLVLVVMITAFVPAIYVSIRLIFWSLAIFDGADIAQGFQATWRISRDAVARMLGWGVMVAVLGLLVRGVAELVTIPLSDGNPVRAGIAAAVTEAFTAYSTIVLAVIYESQRRIHVGWIPTPEYGAPGAGPAEPPAPRGPFDPPPPPGY